MTNIPRRAQTLEWCDAEKAIHAAVMSVESMPADTRLTDAVVLLGQAQSRVADFVDDIPDEEPDMPVATPAPITDSFDLLLAIHAAVRFEGSQKKAAATLGISPQYLNDILKGNREIPDKVAAHFGVRRVILYEKI